MAECSRFHQSFCTELYSVKKLHANSIRYTFYLPSVPFQSPAAENQTLSQCRLFCYPFSETNSCSVRLRC